MSVFSNCGELLFFQPPEQDCPETPPTTPPVYIPNYTSQYIPFEIEDPRPYFYGIARPGRGGGGPGPGGSWPSYYSYTEWTVSDKYKCVQRQIVCGENNSSGLAGNLKECKPCNGAINPNGSINPASDDPGCTYDEPTCKGECNSQLEQCITGPGFNRTNNINVVFPQHQGLTNVNVELNNNIPQYSNTPTTTIIKGQELFSNPSTWYSTPTVNQNKIFQNLKNFTESPTKNININLIAKEGEFNKNFTDLYGYENKTIYDLDKNFFRKNRTQDSPTTQLVPNQVYLNIFNSLIPIEVKYALDIIGTNAPWSEIILQSISLEKIGVSLNPNFFNIINNLSNSSGFKLPLENFLELIRKHLLTNTLDEIDLDYYQNALIAQSQNPIVAYPPIVLEEVRRRAATNIIINKSNYAATERNGTCEQRVVRRQRRLNEDINANIQCQLYSTQEHIPLEIFNEGLYVSSLASGLSVIENAPGDGYYIYYLRDGESSSSVDPLYYTTDVYKSLYSQPSVRFEALTVMNEDPSTDLYVISTSSNEFSQGNYLSSIENFSSLSPIFLKIDLSSVESSSTTNPIVHNVYANYKLLTNQNEIDEFCDSNGFSISRVNVDFRDPFYAYALQTSTLSLRQKDICFTEPGVEVLGRIVTKNIPFGIVLTPVKGSRNNPFAGMSKILYISSGISRRLNIIPSFLYSVPGIYQTPLKEEIINEDGGRVGIVEPVDRRAITFRFDGSSSYQDRFFNNGIYENTISEVSSYGASYLVKEVIDYIIQTYPTYLVSSASSVTWYDVYRRIPANRLGELFYDCGPEFITAISTGYRGITIRNVLNIGAGLVYQLLPNDERCIITLENR